MADPLTEQAAMAAMLREGQELAPAPGAAQEMQNVRRAVALQQNRNPSVWENMKHRLIGVDDPIGFQQGPRPYSQRNPDPSIFDLKPEDLKDL